MNKSESTDRVVKHLQNLRFASAILLAVLSPFHAFLITWLTAAGLSNGIAIWREVIVLVIITLISIELLLKRRRPTLDMLDLTILLFALISLIWLPIQKTPLSQWILGVRYDIMPFIFFIFVRQATWPKAGVIFKYFLASAALVMIFGVLHALILPRDFLTYFGYSTSQLFFDHQSALSACQYLEFTDSVCRATSTFGGPTRFGTYLILVIGLCIPLIKSARTRQFGTSMILIAMLNIVLTYSRSIWIGVAAGTLLLLFVRRNKVSSKKKRAVGLVVGAIVLFGVLISGYALTNKDSLLQKIIVREVSTGEHILYLKQGIERLRENPFGSGVGTVGPASTRYNKALTENWFLQISGEMGIPGLAIFLTMLYLFFEKLWIEKRDPIKLGLLLSLTAITVTGLFTHSFEETTTAVLLMGVVGVRVEGEV